MENTWKGKYGPLLIAEIGGNHEGNFDYAKELTNLAIESGVDFIKYQIYSGDTLVSKIEAPKRNKHFKKFELTKKQYIELAELCKNNGVGFMASVWDLEYISWIDSYMSIYKIGSGDLTAYPILKNFAQLGKPIILSTGLSTINDVKGAVEFIQSINLKYKNPNYLSILQCTSMYPIPFKDSNLEVMNTFKSLFNLPVGYSDHTEGSRALIVASIMGADILEFHFTDTRENKDFRDHKVSLTKSEVVELINEIKIFKELKGVAIKQPLPVESDHVVSFRRAVYPLKDLPSEHILREDDLTVLRPNHGIDAREYYNIIGKKLTKSIKMHQKLDWNLLK